MNMEIIGMIKYDAWDEVDCIISIVRVGKTYYGFSESTHASTLSKLSIENDRDLEIAKRCLRVIEDEIVLPYFNQDLFMDMYQQLQEASVQEIIRR